MKNLKPNKSEGSLLWRIIFGIVLIIFALISLSRFNATAALLYIIISIFIFIPGKKFKIHSKWIKVGIVIIAILIVGFINHFSLVSEPIIEEYSLEQEFLLPNNPNFALTITQAVKEPKIIVSGQEYVSDGTFLLVYFNMRFAGNISSLQENNSIPFSMSFVLKDSDGIEYISLDMDTTEMPQTEALEAGQSFYLFNTPLNATGLKLIFTAKDINKFAVVDLENEKVTS